MKTGTKKIIAVLSAVVMLTGVMAGCGNQGKADDRVELKIGNCPSEDEKEAYALFLKRVEEFENDHPNLRIVGKKYGYDTQSFLPLASSGDLPLVYDTFFTETKKIIEGGYAGDITKQVEERGFDKLINEAFMIDIKRDGKYFAIPFNAYVMGLLCNAQLFKQAGLVDENDVPLYPTSWEDLAEKAKIIQDKTGVQGFFLPTTNNNGGWNFTNIAFGFGAKFEECKDGKWTAVYNSPEMVKAFEYIRDLKYKYNVIGDNALVDTIEFRKRFAAGKVAMGIYAPSSEQCTFSEIIKLNKDLPLEVFSLTALPKGTDGKRRALMGGGLYMFSQTATQEQLDGAFDWLEYSGFTSKLNDEEIKRLEEDMQVNANEGYVVGANGISIWNDPERLKTIETAQEKYRNVDKKFFTSYPDLENTELVPEEPYCAQNLYTEIDALLQKVLLDPNIDIQKMLDESVVSFQTNYLDKATQ